MSTPEGNETSGDPRTAANVQAQPGPEAMPPTAPPLRVTVDPLVGFSARDFGGQTSYVAHHPRLGRYFRIGVEEYRVAALLDGSRTISEVYDQIRTDGLDWTAEDVATFAGELVKQKIATAETDAVEKPSECEPEPSASDQQSDRPNLAQFLPRYLSLVISQRFPLFNGQVIADNAAKFVEPAFTRIGFAIWCVLVASGMMLVYGNADAFGGELQRLFDPGIWPVLIAFWCVAKLIHEMGHAVCAKHYGVRIGNMGIMFFLMAPLAYVDVTDAWKLKRRMQRVHIALAGVYLELGIAAIAAWAWWWLPDGLLRHLAAQVFVVAGPTTLLVNANPLLRLDGYYVVSDLLEIPNLRMHGRAQLSRRFEWLFFGIPGKPSLLRGWRRPAATIHAACSVVFQFFWMGGLIFAVSMWARGLGIVLAIAAFLLWALLPLIRWMTKIWFMKPAESWGLNAYRRRMLGFLLLVATVVHPLCLTSSPLDRRVPVVVRFQDEQIARATANAFVTAVYVGCGSRVSNGMLLVELSDPELALRREAIADNAKLAERLAIQHRRRGEIAQANSESENAASLIRQLAEIDEQIAGLKVVARRDGVITSPVPERLVGRYVNAGDELIRVSDRREKELLAVVAERDMEAYQAAAQSDIESSVRLRGGTSFMANPSVLRPRARRALPHPALAASVGGPIAVEPSSDPNQPMQMIEPQLESITPLEPSTSVRIHAGQVGTMTIADDRSLIARIYDDLMEKAAQTR